MRVRRSLFSGFALLLLLGAGTLLFLEGARIRLEQGLSECLQVPVRIRRLSLSSNRLTLHQVMLRPSPSSSASGRSFSLVIDRLQLQGSLRFLLNPRSFVSSWEEGEVRSVTVTQITCSFAEVPLRVQGRLFLTRQAEGAGTGSVLWSEGWLTLEHPFLKGRMEVSGPWLKPALIGWVEVSQDKRHFAAQLEMMPGGVRLSRMEVQGGWVAETVEWGIRDSNLIFKMEAMRRQVRLNGEVGLQFPYSADMVLHFDGADVSEMVRWLLPKGRVPSLAGSIQGEVRLTGPLTRLSSQAAVTSGEGRLGMDRFLAASLKFRGNGPILQIENSKMTRPGGEVLIEGSVDLRRLGQQDFFSRVHLSSSAKVLDG